jgi:hypothetical protein
MKPDKNTAAVLRKESLQALMVPQSRRDVKLPRKEGGKVSEISYSLRLFKMGKGNNKV